MGCADFIETGTTEWVMTEYTYAVQFINYDSIRIHTPPLRTQPRLSLQSLPRNSLYCLIYIDVTLI